LKRSRGKSGRKGRKDKDKVDGFLLAVIDGQAQGREYHFESRCKIGRVDENDVILVDPGISRQHARLHGRRGVYLVEDMGSSNGTRLNGELIEGPEVLRDGDYVGVGQATVQFSNLDMTRSGEETARIRITDKQKARLDHAGVSGGPKEQLAELWKTPRGKLMAVGGGMALLLLMAGLGKQCTGGKKKRQADTREMSAQAIDYDEYHAKGYWDWAFGYGNYNRNFRDKVTFRYVKPKQKLRVTLEYGAWGVDDSEEVVIFVNGKRVGTVPATRKISVQGAVSYKYDYGLRQGIDPAALKDGENLVTFDNTKNDKSGSEMWEIAYVKLRETAIPAPNQGKARECFFNAKNAYDQRKVDPANLQKSIANYECARDYLEELPRKPPTYAVATREIDRINRELSRIYKTAIFEAQRQWRYGQTDQARAQLQQTLLYFKANPRDPRFIKLREVLGAMGQ
jgi:pSer/pThr/pTyr-binding forkhead associated (FHA) protein